MTGMLKGEYDVGQAAIDNLIAYQEKQAAPDLDVDRDLIGIMATSATNLDLVVRPDIRSYADLKGRVLAVDSSTTGFAFVLRRMLECGGLTEADYTFTEVGGDAARLVALQEGYVAGALLTKDFADQAIAFGLHRLAESLDVLREYQGTSLFTRRKWACTHRDELVHFLRAVSSAHEWIFDPINTPEAASILARQTAGMPAASAAVLVQQLRASRGGLSRTGAFDIEGLKVVMSLRREYGMPERELGDPSRYFDASYLALAGAGAAADPARP
jgi:ABC-type nitrate/sulfonate/bicarbonate transport system substrate-binding protein